MPAILNRGDLEITNKNLESFHFALAAVEAAIRSVDPYRLIKKHMKVIGHNLIITDISGNTTKINLSRIKQTYIVGAGKASGKMALAVQSVLGHRRIKGAVNIPYDSGITSDLISLNEAGHPIPDKNGIAGVKKILDLLKQAGKSDLVIVLISGGGSALLPMPIRGISLPIKKSVTRSLLLSGASIDEVNAVRKHLSKVKGGKLLNYVDTGSRVVSLIISDVIGDHLSIIASGPTYYDISTFLQAKEILTKYALWESKDFVLVRRIIENGINGKIQETIKPGDKLLANVSNVLIGNNEMACNAALETLKKMRVNTLYLGSAFGGLAIDHGKYIASLANQLSSYCLPSALVLGGETVVKVSDCHQNGIGGRNQEAALSSAMSLEYKKNMDLSICCIGTDGIDGNSTYAGAFVTSRILPLISTNRIKYKAYLSKHDSSRAFKELKSVVITGRTGTNVNDISIIVRFR